VLGMGIFMMRKRMKEIAIRKVIGATVTQIALLLSGGFFKQLLVACLIGIPLSILFMSSFLNQFTYRINPITGYIAGSIVLFVVVFSVIISRIIYSAKTNPARSLKIE
jgi:putative ABC transport system permease protein